MARTKANPNKKTATKPRSRPGTVALREIKKLQRSVDTLIPRAPFLRLVEEISKVASEQLFAMTGDQPGTKRVQPGFTFRWTRNAASTLQEAAEQHLTELFEKAYYLTLHRKKVTLIKDDVVLARHLIYNDHERHSKESNELGPYERLPNNTNE